MNRLSVYELSVTERQVQRASDSQREMHFVIIRDQCHSTDNNYMHRYA